MSWVLGIIFTIITFIFITHIYRKPYYSSYNSENTWERVTFPVYIWILYIIGFLLYFIPLWNIAQFIIFIMTMILLVAVGDYDYEYRYGNGKIYKFLTKKNLI